MVGLFHMFPLKVKIWHSVGKAMFRTIKFKNIWVFYTLPKIKQIAKIPTEPLLLTIGIKKFYNYKDLINQGLRLKNVMSAKQWLSYGEEHNILNFKYVAKKICFPHTCAYKQN